MLISEYRHQITFYSLCVNSTVAILRQQLQSCDTKISVQNNSFCLQVKFGMSFDDMLLDM